MSYLLNMLLNLVTVTFCIPRANPSPIVQGQNYGIFYYTKLR